MEKKIILKGNVVAICPECGLEIPVSITDLIMGNEILCPAGKHTAHPKAHSEKNHHWCADPQECKPSTEYHSFTVEQGNFIEL